MNSYRKISTYLPIMGKGDFNFQGVPVVGYRRYRR